MLFEIHLETPISAIFNSNNDEAYEVLSDYLDEERDIFANKNDSKIMFDEFPIVSTWIEGIKKFTNEKFLPKPVTTLIKRMLEFNEEYLEKAHICDSEEPGPHQQGAVMAEVYPKNPQHTANEKFAADKGKDAGEIRNCTKIFPEANGMTGGLGHITCSHGITKGYSAIEDGEGANLYAKPMFKRLPKRVKAARRVFIYDNNCNYHKFLLRRYPWRSRRWTFVIDRMHFKNHKNCSSAYNMDS